MDKFAHLEPLDVELKEEYQLLWNNLGGRQWPIARLLIKLIIAAFHTPLIAPFIPHTYPHFLSFLHTLVRRVLSWCTHSPHPALPTTFIDIYSNEDYVQWSARSRHLLSFWDERFDRAESIFVSQLVLYHVPRLTPYWREKLERVDEGDIEARDYSIPVRAFCKWHRMVYPGSNHPTHRQAIRLMKSFSHRDLQKIYNMAKSSKDGAYHPKYRQIWREWLDRKGPDITIVFE
ncbi:hypothetical protein SISSUDRAFT_1132725 [Sistotremastrum suecicum HHB10207 ss-3]|uniref:Uncharacterized protein n=1 Tax=Sistotremastrum suecicum HHB10207 ss-3 TaxID=1314776 RepID=A0A165YE77_9AGAM|nr:hypothetical protein SISSUDRAFT_1132725 [Sistotremastrum suecicum HHB10207 ss-3]